MVPNTGKILDPTSFDKHNRVLLKVVAFSRNIGRDFDPVCETNTSHFPESGIRFFRCGSIYTSTNTPLLRIPF